MVTERLVLLGVDHAEYTRLAVHTQAGGRTAAVMSVGGEYVRMRKGDLLVANEDACVAIDDGERTLVAVCDGHHGHQASHGLAEGLGLVEGCRATERTHHDVLMLNLPKKNRPASGGRRASRSDRGG